jgi:putative ABC transport system permease protein
MTFVSGWRLAVRLAWREAWRSKARSVLVLVMVTFPVVAVIAADVAQATSSVSSVEGLDRRMGSAQARISAIPHAGQVFQEADPDRVLGVQGQGSTASWPSIEKVLGARPHVVLVTAQAAVRTSLGVLQADATGVDMSDPLAKGLFRLTSGHFPHAGDEVAVNAALSGYGFGVGDRMRLANGTTVTVVGTAESAGERTAPVVLAMPSLFPSAGAEGLRTWLVGGPPVSWPEVRAVNAVGASVLSRAVVEHPPSRDQLPPQIRDAGSSDSSTLYTVLALVAVMALIEVVLLAGPAFAVGARRQSRSLALIAANGGTPAQSRRVILGSALVIGVVAAALGVGLGIGLARALVPFLQSHAQTYFGPFQIRWSHVLAVSAFGLLSAVLAAVVPAWIASRQDVVAVLAGRRGDRAPSRRSPWVGVGLTSLGVALATLGARRANGATLIAGAAVLTVLGMVFLVPVVVVGVARLGRRLPLPLRYAVRDAARHRTRTVPAVAAVAATVAGAVALSIGNTSDEAQAKADYRPLLPMGLAQVFVNEHHPDWAAMTAAVHRLAPSARVSEVPSVARQSRISVEAPPGTRPAGGGGIVVGDGSDQTLDGMLAAFYGKSAPDVVDAALRSGRVVVFTSRPSGAAHVVIRIGRTPHRVAAAYVAVPSGPGLAQAVVPTALAHSLGLRQAPSSLLLSGPTLTRAQESDLRQVLSGIDGASHLYVERGWQQNSSTRIVLWILFGLAAVLMVGGTLTATFLALSDARPDLATLSAVGASPRTRRAVAAAYAVSVALVGAVLGAAVGFVPGIAVSYPLTRSYGGLHSHYLVIPWVLITGLVVLLPVLTATVVGLLARSRLPLVARLD